MLCPTCHYDLTGLIGGTATVRCPECGTPAPRMTCRNCSTVFTPGAPVDGVLTRCPSCGFWQPHHHFAPPSSQSAKPQTTQIDTDEGG